MPLSIYLAEPHTRQLEDLAARALARALRLALPGDEPASIAFNLQAYNQQLDAVLITQHAITVIDWKDTLGPISGDESSAWMRPDGPVLAGTFVNPYQQLFAARRTVSSFLEKEAAEIFEDGGYRFSRKEFLLVSAALVFTPVKPELNLNLPARARSWLVITGLDTAAVELAALRSQLALNANEMAALIEKKWHGARWAELESVLPDQIVGRLWQIEADGTRRGWPITKATKIGRGKDCDLQFPSSVDSVSREHAQILVAGEVAVIYDLDSTNGTHIDGARLTPGEACPLRPGQRITLGAPSASDSIALHYTAGSDTEGQTIRPTRTQVGQ